jgi:glycosyltransferase involved in cell wall biosynthesis
VDSPEPTRDRPTHILYVGAVLPKRSETFVYRELLGLRARGIRVTAASVREPEQALGDPVLDELAQQALVVYALGMLPAALLGAFRWPRVAGRGLIDAVAARDLRLSQRPRVLVQLAGALGLAWRLRSSGITHVHAHMAHVPTTIAMYTAAALGVPMSFTGHAADLFRDRQLLPTKLRRAKAVLCISHWHREFYRRWVNLPDARMPVVRCGVDLAEFTPGGGGAGILAVGRLVPKKGFDTLIRAIGILVRRPSMKPEDVRLTLIGDGPEREPLEMLAAELGVERNVHFTGAGTQRQVREAMRSAELFALPCRVSSDGDRDGIPVVLMEAMASGLPVVCGDLPTIRELVVDDTCGRLVEPDDPKSLASQIEVLLTNDSERRSVADAGRRRVAEEFSLEATLDQLVTCFVGGVPERGGGSPDVRGISAGSAASRDS